MNELVVYLLKAAVINAVILGFYYFVLRKSNKFSIMRLTLLLAMVLPLILPLIPIADSINAFLSSNQNRDISAITSITLPSISINSTFSESAWPTITKIIYYSITGMLIIGMVFSIISIIKIRISSIKHPTEYGNILLEKEVKSPFSFFHWVFLPYSYLNHSKLKMLLKHEFCHVHKMHSIDRLISGMFRSILWFSPFSHMTVMRLIEVHEYQADANVLKSDIIPSEYSDLVLSFYYDEIPDLRLTNSFSFHIKKRITMINNLNVGRLRIGRILSGLSIALIAIFTTAMMQPQASGFSREKFTSIAEINTPSNTVTTPAYPTMDISLEKNSWSSSEIIGSYGEAVLSQQVDVRGVEVENQIPQNDKPQKDPNVKNKAQVKKQKNKEGDEKMIFYVVEEIPTFPGGDEARTKYLSSNVIYPQEARAKGIEGTVYMTFIIEEDGSVTDVKVLRGVNELIDKAALDAVSGMPKWEPGKQKGKPVAVQFNMPIKFSLEKNKKNEENKVIEDETQKGKTNPFEKVK